MKRLLLSLHAALLLASTAHALNTHRPSARGRQGHVPSQISGGAGRGS